MKRALAVLRRLFGGGTITFILALLVSGKSFGDLISLATEFNGFISVFSIFLLLSPVLYIIFLFISAAYIRKNGYTADCEKARPLIATVFTVLKSDLSSPFRCVWSFLKEGLFGKYPDIYPEDLKKKARRTVILRFLWMIFVILFLLYGLGTLCM